MSSSVSTGSKPKRLSREAYGALNSMTSELRSQQNVDFGGRSIGTEGLKYLAEALAFNTATVAFNLSKNEIEGEGIAYLVNALEHNTTLEDLDLGGNAMQDEGAKVSQRISRNLLFGFNGTSPTRIMLMYPAGFFFCQTLCEFMANSPSINIKRLSLATNNIGDDGAVAIAEMLTKNRTLESIDLSNNLIDYDGFVALAQAMVENQTLKEIYLDGNYAGAMGSSAFFRGISKNEGIALEEIHIQGTYILSLFSPILDQVCYAINVHLTKKDGGGGFVGASNLVQETILETKVPKRSQRHWSCREQILEN